MKKREDRIASIIKTIQWEDVNYFLTKKPGHLYSKGEFEAYQALEQYVNKILNVTPQNLFDIANDIKENSDTIMHVITLMKGINGLCKEHFLLDVQKH